MATRDSYIQANLQEIGLDSFPENADVAWQMRGTWHRGEYSMVEAEASPSTVGYPRFRFVLRFDAETRATAVGCYVLDKGVWDLLFTDPAFGTEWQALFGEV